MFKLCLLLLVLLAFEVLQTHDVSIINGVSNEEMNKMKINISNDNVESYWNLSAETRKVDIGYPDLTFKHDVYLTYQQQCNWLLELALSEPTFTLLVPLGTTYKGHDICSIYINPENKKLPLIWIDGNMGAREWISSASVLYLVEYIVLSDEKQAKSLRNNYRFIIVPNLNPDGYMYSMTEDRQWVKNVREFSKLCTGVNLKYNFDAEFPQTNSNKICNEKYAGIEYFSENETKTVERVFNANQIISMVFSIQSYGQMWLIPYACCNSTPNDFHEMLRVANIAVKAIKKETKEEFAVGKASDLLNEYNKGTSMDWSKIKRKVAYSYIISLRPKTSGQGGYILNPSHIIPSGRDLMAGVSAAVLNANL